MYLPCFEVRFDQGKLKLIFSSSQKVPSLMTSFPSPSDGESVHYSAPELTPKVQRELEQFFHGPAVKQTLNWLYITFGSDVGEPKKNYVSMKSIKRSNTEIHTRIWISKDAFLKLSKERGKSLYKQSVSCQTYFLL